MNDIERVGPRRGDGKLYGCRTGSWDRGRVAELDAEGRTIDTLEALVQDVYEASLTPERLVVAIQAIADALDADAGVLMVQDEGASRLAVNVVASRQDLGDAPARFELEYAFAPDGPFSGQPRSAVTAASTVWQDALGSIASQGVVATVGETGLLALFRQQERLPFDDAACAQLQTVAGRLEGALRLLRQLAEAQARHEILTGVLDLVAAPLIVVEGSGYVVFTNVRAREFLQGGYGLTVNAAGCLAVDPAVIPVSRSSGRLAEAVRSVAHDVLEQNAGAMGVAIPRANGRSPLRIVLHALRRRTSLLSGQKPLVALHLSSEGQSAVVEAKTLQSLFSLTPAEAALLQALVQDKRLEEYAEDRGVSVTTVRTQLAHLFRKTGTNRQSELVRLALVVVGTLQGHGEE